MTIAASAICKNSITTNKNKIINLNIKDKLDQETINCCFEENFEVKSLKSAITTTNKFINSSTSVLSIEKISSEAEKKICKTIPECTNCQQLKKNQQNSLTTISVAESVVEEISLIKSNSIAPISQSLASSSMASSNTLENCSNNLKENKCYKNQLTSTFLNNSSLNRNFIGTLIVSLPDGTIIECQPISKNISECNLLKNILRPGDCLLRLLYGKSAQTMLLNAFCGHAKRRMYARLKWGDSGEIKPCEFLCEFSMSSNDSATRIANIQIFCVNISTFSNFSSTITGNNTINATSVFTTRHNAFCSVIYLDSASIPILGHFPSEITGKSLFALIYFEDVEAVKQAHKKLHDTCGADIISTPGLRFCTYEGNAICVDSEWSAFVNPWNYQIEMIVGRHVLNNELTLNNKKTKIALNSKTVAMYDAIVQEILFKPVKMHQKGFCRLSTLQTKSSLATKNNVNFQKSKSDNNYENYNDLNNNSINERVKYNLLKNNIKTSILNQSDNQSNNLLNNVCLSYNQINCLENVHRLLKSQVDNKKKCLSTNCIEKELNCINQSKEIASIQPLTQELLEQHNRKWEDKFKKNWKQRLTMKRIANTVLNTSTIPKVTRLVNIEDNVSENEFWNNLIKKDNKSFEINSTFSNEISNDLATALLSKQFLNLKKNSSSIISTLSKQLILSKQQFLTTDLNQKNFVNYENNNFLTNKAGQQQQPLTDSQLLLLNNLLVQQKQFQQQQLLQ